MGKKRIDDYVSNCESNCVSNCASNCVSRNVSGNKLLSINILLHYSPVSTRTGNLRLAGQPFFARELGLPDRYKFTLTIGGL